MNSICNNRGAALTALAAALMILSVGCDKKKPAGESAAVLDKTAPAPVTDQAPADVTATASPTTEAVETAPTGMKVSKPDEKYLKAKNLTEALNMKRADFQNNAPAEKVELYEKAIINLRNNGAVTWPLNVGAEALDFELVNIDGVKVRLSELAADKMVFLVWYRGGWCPYCSLQLAKLQELKPKFDKNGVSIVAISPQLPAYTKMTAEELGLDFYLLSDPDNLVARRYGLVYQVDENVWDAYLGFVDLPKVQGSSAKELPLTVSYIIDSKLKIRLSSIDADYRNRLDPEKVLDAIPKISR